MDDKRVLFSWATLRHIWQLLGRTRQRQKSVLALLLVVQVLQLFSPYLFKRILDLFAHLNRTSVRELITLIALSFVLSELIAWVKKYRDRHIFDTLLTIERDLPITVQAKLMSLSLGFHEQQETGNTITKVQRGVDKFVELIANALFDFIPTLVQTIGTFVFLVVLDWRIALVFFPINPLFMWLTRWMNQKVRPLRLRRIRGYEEAGGQMAESLMNIHTVQSFSQQHREISDQTRIRDDIYATESTEWRMMISLNFVRDSLINVGRNLVLLFSVFLLYRHEISLGSLVLFVTLSETAYVSLYRMSRLFDRAAEWTEAIFRLSKLLNEEPHVVEATNARTIGPIRGQVEFRRVSFAYNGNGPALHDVSCLIEPGKTIALVGPSGCGKSTYVKLLFRHYDPNTGEILIDGQPLRELTLDSFRRQMAIVPQEVEIFNDTIRNNISYGKPEATMEEIMAAAQLANAHDFILSLPDGYDTEVGERGVKLSGGQRQRVGIARAVLPEPRILVFDEATSSLDSQSERLIQDAMHNIARDRTVIVIAHRLSTVRAADWIYVFNEAELQESGTHDDLLRMGGLYAHLHGLQSGAQLIEDCP